MMTAMVAVDNIINGITTKENIWSVNAEEEYHETKQNASSGNRSPVAGRSE
jgi:hypothetical protein